MNNEMKFGRCEAQKLSWAIPVIRPMNNKESVITKEAEMGPQVFLGHNLKSPPNSNPDWAHINCEPKRAALQTS